MSNYQDQLEPYRHLARQIKSVSPMTQATKRDDLRSVADHRNDLEPYRQMVHQIYSGKGTATAQPPAWPQVELTFAAKQVLAGKRQEDAQTLQLSQHQTADLEPSSSAASRTEKIHQIEQELSQLRGQLAQRAQENQERAERLAQLERQLNQVQQVEIPAQARFASAESIMGTEAPEILHPSTQAQQQTKPQQSRENLADITAQSSFPMIVMLMALVVVAFSLIKLATFAGIGLRTLFSAVATRVQAASPDSKWVWWVDPSKRAVLQRG